MREHTMKDIINRLYMLVVNPTYEWQKILKDDKSAKETYMYYLLPIIMLSSIISLTINCINLDFDNAFYYTISIIITESLCAYICYIIAREFLNNKTKNASNIASKITFNTLSVFCIPFALYSGLEDNSIIRNIIFILSLYSIYVMYKGIFLFRMANYNDKKNLFILLAISLIAISTIIKQSLIILFKIPVFNI